MVSFTKLYWISDISAAVLGVILNSTLLFSIFKTTKAKINPYTYLVLIPCINDLIVSGYALLLQHEIKVDDGIITVFAEGVEQYLPKQLLIVTAFLHLFTVTNVFAAQPVIYYYRYLLVTNSGADSTKILFRNLCFSISASAIVGFFFALSCNQSFYKSPNFYTDKLSSLWLHPDGSTCFIYASDWNDHITKIYFLVVNLAFSSAIGLSFVVLVMSVKSMYVQNEQVSEKTRKLKQQFTRTVIGQSIVLALFALFPSSIYMMALFLRLKTGDYLGMTVLIPMSWFPVLNALLPMIFVSTIRKFVVSLFVTQKRISRIGNSSITEKSVKSTVS